MPYALNRVVCCIFFLLFLLSGCKKDTPRPVYSDPPEPPTKAPAAVLDSASGGTVNNTGSVSYGQTVTFRFMATAPGEFTGITLYKKSETGSLKTDSLGAIVLSSLTEKTIAKKYIATDTVSPVQFIFKVTDTQNRKDSAAYTIYIKPTITLKVPSLPDSLPGLHVVSDSGDAGSRTRSLYIRSFAPGKISTLKLLKGSKASGFTEVGSLNTLTGKRRGNNDSLPYNITEASGSVQLNYVLTDSYGYADTAILYLKVLPNVVTQGLTLNAQNSAGGHYFSADNPLKSWSDDQAFGAGGDSSGKIDLVYYNNESDSASFAAPDVFSGPGANPPANVGYPIDNWTAANSTRMVRITDPTVNFSNPAHPIQYYYDAVQPQLSSITKLHIGDLIAFKTNVSNKYGFLKIIHINPGNAGSMVFDIKIQQ